MAIQCPHCNTYNVTSAEFCKKCGASFKAKLSKIDAEETEKRPGLLDRLFKKK